jgi:RNA-directed DNA polymerase
MKSRESGWSEGGGCREARSVGPTSDLRREIWEAYLKVKSYKGAAGVDEQRIEDFEKDLKRNLYIVWNRMSSGSYFSSPVVTIR